MAVPVRPATGTPQPLGEADLFVGGEVDDGLVEAGLLKAHLLKHGVLTPACARALIARATAVVREEPNVLRRTAPITVFGDIHGQYFDLLSGIELGGDPADVQYLFLGDYVDRGDFSTEVVLYLYALKINHPHNIALLRGNHESRRVSNNFNFRAECEEKYDDELFEVFMDSFDNLPIAAHIDVDDDNRVFACHGGISPKLKTVDEINDVDRFLEIPASGILTDLTWADPCGESTTTFLKTDDDWAEWAEMDWLPNPARGLSVMYGYAAIADFLTTNGYKSILRAHQVQPAGFNEHEEFIRVHAGVDSVWPPVITVFSAPNYCGEYGNSACILTLTPELNEETGRHYTLTPYHQYLKYRPPPARKRRHSLKSTAVALQMMLRMYKTRKDGADAVEELKNLTGGTLPQGALSGGADELEAALGRFKAAAFSDLVNERAPPEMPEPLEPQVARVVVGTSAVAAVVTTSTATVSSGPAVATITRPEAAGGVASSSAPAATTTTTAVAPVAVITPGPGTSGSTAGEDEDVSSGGNVVGT